MTASEDNFKYTGVDNLEVMLEAKRYNAFLTDQVLKHRVGTGTILDFGAGIGTFSEMVRSRGFEVDCMEVDADECDILKTKGFTVFPRTEDIADASYDYIFSLNVFEHIEHDLDAMKECWRILRPGGRKFIYVPAFQMLFGDMDRKVEHCRRYSRTSLERLATDAGMIVERSGYVDVAGFFATLLYNAMSRGSGDINTKQVIVYDRYIFPLSRILDIVAHPFIGKNAFVLARKPKHPEKSHTS